MAMVEQIIQRANGAQVRIVAQEFFGMGLTRSVDVRVHHRESADQAWKLAGDRPHPNWRSMSVDEYIKHGRPEKLQVASVGELLKVTAMLPNSLH